MTNERLKQITAELNRMTSDEIVGVSYGLKEVNGKTTDQKVIVFTVIRKKPLSEIPESSRIPSQLEFDGEIFDTDVIEGTISAFAYGYCDPSFYDWQSQPPGNRNTHRPLMGGVSVTNYTAMSNYVGTLGFIAVDNETDTLVGVSNNHVLCDDAFFTTDRNVNGPRTNVFTPDGHKTTQPNEIGNYGFQNTVGKVKKYQPISPVPFNNEVDCALLSLDPTDDGGQPTVDPAVSWNQFGISGMTRAPRFATTQELDTMFENPNQVYYSSGRTTGPKGQQDTKLFCVASNSSITINYKRQGADTTCYMNDTFELQASGSTTPQGDWCYYPSAGGDSGSAILTEIEGSEGMEWVIVGLLYGGRQIPDPEDPENYLPITTLCNRIDNVASALNIRAWDGTMNGIFYANNQGPLTYVHGGTSSDTYKIINGVKYWQMGMVNNSEYPPDPTPQPTSTPQPTATEIPPTPTPTVDTSSFKLHVYNQTTNWTIGDFKLSQSSGAMSSRLSFDSSGTHIVNPNNEAHHSVTTLDTNYNNIRVNIPPTGSGTYWGWYYLNGSFAGLGYERPFGNIVDLRNGPGGQYQYYTVGPDDVIDLYLTDTNTPPVAEPTATPNPTATPQPTSTPNPTPTSTPNPTATPSPQTLVLGYDHENTCTSSNLQLFVNGVQNGANINLSQGGSGTGTVRTVQVYPGDNIQINYKPFNLLSPCTNAYQQPSVRIGGTATGSITYDTNNYSTLSYTVQAGVNPTFTAYMENTPAPTATPIPSYTLTLQNVTSATYAESCAKGYVTIEKNGTEVARLTKVQGNTYANWNSSSISFTSTDNVVMKSYSQGGGGSGCTTSDTTVRCVYNGSAKTSSTLDTGTNGQSFQIPDANGTAFGWFFEVGGL